MVVENPGVEPGTSAMRQQRSSRHELIPLVAAAARTYCQPWLVVWASRRQPPTRQSSGGWVLRPGAELAIGSRPYLQRCSRPRAYGCLAFGCGQVGSWPPYVSAVELTSSEPVAQPVLSPVPGGSQGRRDSNSQLTRFWRPGLFRLSYTPMDTCLLCVLSA